MAVALLRLALESAASAKVTQGGITAVRPEIALPPVAQRPGYDPSGDRSEERAMRRPRHEAGAALGTQTVKPQPRVAIGRQARRPMAAASASTRTPSRTGEPSLIGRAVFGAAPAN